MKKISREFWIKAALCCAGYGLVSNAIITPIFAAITQEFPNASDGLVNFTRTGNFIISVPFALLTAPLTKYVSKKKLLVVALTLFCIGGIGAAFSTSMAFLAVTRMFDAASDGMATALVCSLITEVFKDEKTRSQVMGLQNGFSCALGIIIGIPAGFLATFGWRYAFLLNCGCLLSLALVIFFVPDIPPVRTREEPSANIVKSAYRGQVGVVVLNLIMFFIIQMLYSQILYMLGSIVDELNLGTTVFSGTMVSAINITMVATYAVFSPCYLKLKRWLPITCFIATGLGMGLMAVTGTRFLFGVLVVVTTLAASLAYPYCPLVIGDCIPEDRAPFWMSVYSVILYTANSVSSYIPSWISSVTGTKTIAGTFVYSGGLLVVLAVVMMVLPKFFAPDPSMKNGTAKA